MPRATTIAQQCHRLRVASALFMATGFAFMMAGSALAAIVGAPMLLSLVPGALLPFFVGGHLADKANALEHESTVMVDGDLHTFCRRCGYDLYGVKHDACPECGELKSTMQ